MKSVTSFGLLILGLVTVQAKAIHGMPTDSVHNLLGRQFVDGVNDTSQAQRRSLAGQIYAESSVAEVGIDRLVGLFARLREQYGQLDYHHSEVTGNYLHIFAQSRLDKQWHDFQFSLTSEPKPKLKQIMFIADVAEPIYLPNGDIGDPHTLNWLNDYVDKLVKDNDLSAAILLARGDSIFYERYVGYADAARTRRINATTRCNLASGGKMFTALAVMQLHESGKLALTDPIVSFMPDYPDSILARKATIHNLLSHTSGLGDIFGEAFTRTAGNVTKLRQMLPYVYDDSLAFSPGTGFQYSNSGYILAGLAVEEASGVDYYTYLQDNLLKPLGMSQTDFFMHNQSGGELAERLAKSKEGWQAIKSEGRGSSAGGGYSTARDMFTFARALNAGRIVSRTTLEKMIEPKNLEYDKSYPYGYGFTLRLNRGRLVSYGHGGIAGGVNFELQIYPDDDITMILFCNQDNGAYDDLRKNIVKLITGDR